VAEDSAADGPTAGEGGARAPWEEGRRVSAWQAASRRRGRGLDRRRGEEGRRARWCAPARAAAAAAGEMEAMRGV
jgi:hypothetical protein